MALIENGSDSVFQRFWPQDTTHQSLQTTAFKEDHIQEQQGPPVWILLEEKSAEK